MAAVGQSEVLRREMALSELAPRVLQSEIRAMTVLAEAAGGVNLAQGVCDTEVPEVVAEGAHAAIRDGHNIYTRLDGIARLRRAIATKVERSTGVAVDADREVLVTSGATGAFHAAAMALLNPGDEVILFEPLYGYHVGTLRAMRCVPVVVPLDGANGWALDLKAVRAAVTERTRAVVINTPSNPAGKIFSKAELEGLAEIAREHELFCFTDEIYECFVYGDERHVSPFALDGMRERTVLMSGFSKTFSVTGWRVGYLVADARWVGSIGYFHDLTYVCAPAPFQHGCAAGLEQLPQGVLRTTGGGPRGQAGDAGGGATRCGHATACAGRGVLHPGGCLGAAGGDGGEAGAVAAGADGGSGGGGFGVLPARVRARGGSAAVLLCEAGRGAGGRLPAAAWAGWVEGGLLRGCGVTGASCGGMMMTGCVRGEGQ